MIFEVGNPQRPKGNAIFYYYIKGKNPFFPGYKIIASNVMISLLPSGSDAQIASFPPVGIDDYETLREIVDREGTDLIKLPDFVFPDSKSMQSVYLKKRVNEFNDMVNAYFQRYKTRDVTRSNDLDEYQHINYFGKLALEVRSMVDSKMNMPLIKRYERQLRTMLKNITTRPYRQELSKLLDLLTIENKDATDIIDKSIRKCVAIYKEEYEEAARLNDEIEKLEKTLSR